MLFAWARGPEIAVNLPAAGRAMNHLFWLFRVLRGILGTLGRSAVVASLRTARRVNDGPAQLALHPPRPCPRPCTACNPCAACIINFPLPSGSSVVTSISSDPMCHTSTRARPPQTPSLGTPLSAVFLAATTHTVFRLCSMGQQTQFVWRNSLFPPVRRSASRG
jgi:hypothetical protein